MFGHLLMTRRRTWSDRRLPSNPKLENQSISSSPIWAADSIILQHQQGARGQLRCLEAIHDRSDEAPSFDGRRGLYADRRPLRHHQRRGRPSGNRSRRFCPTRGPGSRGHICRALAGTRRAGSHQLRNPRNRNRGFPKRMNTPHLKIVPRPSSPPAFCKRARN